MKSLPELTKAEYDILSVLWKKRRASVREVHDQLQSMHAWAYTTTKTVMDRMTKKELLCREAFHGVYVYKPMISRPAGLARFVQFFAQNLLEIDASQVVSMFAEHQTLSEQEIKELEQLLQEDEHHD
ncbi:MAG: BlaI/MecI/CopY family transcriptional regulator [candidate division KSB1 bacterium]|nr:BlaI/MecI/CopY family transcriptional regulator [candidate division KSB1 bacterium]